MGGLFEAKGLGFFICDLPFEKLQFRVNRVGYKKFGTIGEENEYTIERPQEVSPNQSR